MTVLFRPRQSLYIPGVEVLQPRASASASTWWDNNGAIAGCVAAYAPKGAADLAASYVNLANPGTFDTAPGVAPTFNTADGWTFNGSTTKLLVGLSAAAKPFTIVARITVTSLAAPGTVVGPSAAGGMQLRTDAGTGTLSYLSAFSANLATSSTSVVVATPVIVAVTYSGSGVVTFYIDGIAAGTATNNQTFSASTIVVGMNDAGAGNGEPFSGVMAAISMYSATLSAGEVATLTTLMNLL